MHNLSHEKLLLLAMQRPSLPDDLSLEDTLLLLVGRFGVDAVKKAAEEVTKGKPGRKTLPDWPKLLEALRNDAQDFLSGDPEPRTRNAIAGSLAESLPGNSGASTKTRLRRKIEHRDWWVHVLAVIEAEGAHPYQRYIAALEKLVELKDTGPKGTQEAGDMWGTKLKRARQLLAEYELAKGGQPDPNLTFKALEEAVVNLSMRSAPLALAPLGFLLYGPATKTNTE